MTGPGSIHPKTNAPYAVEWRTIPAMPDILLDRLCEIYGAPKATEAAAMTDEVKRETATLDRFLEYYEVPTTGDWFNKARSWYKPIECPWIDEHENSNQGTSTCVVFTEGGGYGFDCKHRCASKEWKEFRAELESRFPDKPKFRFSESTPEVSIGRSLLDAEDVEIVEELDPTLTATPLPDYPATVFEGTLYLEFAQHASRGTFIPLAFFIEGAMTYAGAIAGDQLHGMADEITPRLYTVFIAPPGIGKGTTFRRIRRFAPSLRLLNDVPEKFIPSCSALVDRAGSENGLNDALLKCPRVIEEFEELDRMMEKTEIKGSGKALMSIIRTCFDDTVPGITTTSGRPVAANLAFLSLLGAITPGLWRGAMEGRDSYGSGLGGRFNLVASNEDRTASTLLTMDLGDLQEQLERKFVELESHDTTIPTEKDALKVLDDWWTAKSRGKPHYNRVNVIAHRKALHLAWIRGLPVITTEIMQQALQLAEYLVAVRDVFAVVPGEDKMAISENRIKNVLRQIYPKAVRAKQIVELLGGLASRCTVLRALESLANVGDAEKIVRKDSSSKKPYAVFRLNLK